MRAREIVYLQGIGKRNPTRHKAVWLDGVLGATEYCVKN